MATAYLREAMTREQHTRLTKVLAELSALYPDWRLGQIVANIAWWARGPTNEAVWEIEDEGFLAAAEARLARRLTATVSGDAFKPESVARQRMR